MAAENNVNIEVILKNAPPISFQIDAAYASRGLTKEFLLQTCQQYTSNVTAEDVEDATVNVSTTAFDSQSGSVGSGDPAPVPYYASRNTSSGGQWTSKAVKCLISTYRELQNKFSCPDIMKREAWGIVAAVMKTKGYSVTGSQCDDKMRNLKFRHKVLSDKRKEKGEEGCIRWEHMRDMDNLVTGVIPEDSATLTEAGSQADPGEEHRELSQEQQEGLSDRSSSSETTTPAAPVVRRLTLSTSGSCCIEEKRDDAPFAKAEESLVGISTSFLGPYWSPAAVKCLIATYKTLQHKFHSTDIMKREAWELVADVMRRKGFYVTGSHCDEKMRNLRFRHKQICEKRQKTGKEEQKRWEHLDDMDDLMASAPPVEPVSLVSTTTTTTEASRDVSDGGGSAGGSLWRHCPESQDKTALKMKFSVNKMKAVARRKTLKTSGEGQLEDSADLKQDIHPESFHGMATSSSGGQWSGRAVSGLIATYRALLARFHSPQLRKREAWEMVADVMRTKGFPVTGAECDSKMRNLRFRHKMLVDKTKKNKSEGKRPKWKYMQEMDDLMTEEKPIVEPVALIKVNSAEMSSDVNDDESAGEGLWEHSSGIKEEAEETNRSAVTLNLRKRRKAKTARRYKEKRQESTSFYRAESDADGNQESSSGISISGGVWSTAAVKCLIATYRSLKARFQCPAMMKREAWELVAVAMRRKGHSVTGLQCDSKMRYLKFRHRMRDIKRRFGSKPLRYWEYMEDMDDLAVAEKLGEPPATSPTKKGGNTEASSDAADDDTEVDGEEEEVEESAGDVGRDPKEEGRSGTEEWVTMTTRGCAVRQPSPAPGGSRALEEMRGQGPVSEMNGAANERPESSAGDLSSGREWWSSGSVKCLVRTCRGLQGKGGGGSVKKKRRRKEWRLVATAMRRKGCSVTGAMCQEKMRRLGVRHRQTKDQTRNPVKKRERDSGYWEHTQDVDSLTMKEEETVEPVALIKVNTTDMSSDVADDNDDDDDDDDVELARQELEEESDEGGTPKKPSPIFKQFSPINPARGSSRQEETGKESAPVTKVESMLIDSLESRATVSSSFPGAQWSSSAVRCLIATYRALQSKFLCEDIMKKDAWEMVALAMKSKGHRVTGSQCDDKMRNLKFRHKVISDRRLKNPEKGQRIRWEHLQAMDALMAGGATVEPARLVGMDIPIADDRDVYGHGSGEEEDRELSAQSQEGIARKNDPAATATSAASVIRQRPLEASGSQRLEEKSDSKDTVHQLTVDGNVYRQWRRLRRSQGFSSDSQIAAFLLQYYEKKWVKKESGTYCSGCQRALPPLCSTCGPAQQDRDDRDMPSHTWLGGHRREKDSHNSEPTSPSVTRGPGGGVLRDAGRATVTAENLAGSSEDTVMYTSGLHPGSHDDTHVSVLSSGELQAPTVSDTYSTSVRSTATEIKPTGEKYSVRPFPLDDVKHVTVSAAFTKGTRQSQLMSQPQAPEADGVTESSPLGSDAEDNDCDGDTGVGEDVDGVSVEVKREVEVEVKTPLNVRLSRLSRVLNRRMRHRTPRKTWGPPPYLCQQCGISFNKSSNLIRHIYKHTGEYPYPCPECDSAFVTRTELDQHFRKHTGEKPFLCPICGTSYSRACNLETHMRTHTGERPYKCGHCTAQFTTSSARNRHQRMHTGEKPYVCSQCNAAFQQLNMLKVHQYHHSGVRSHQCQKCGIAFFRKACLLRHQRKVQCTKP
ncbi:uncharacterized protein LOC143275613 isoform X2 [Babylonia areolata]|uniref:uncharacterized protein LOC143275613 isoform X2 n=1 Tax=Babylonia areolata TaxID=304850 RepID=UPI003FD0AF7E